MALNETLQIKNVFSLWDNYEQVTTSVMPILEINEFPIRKLKICVGCWEWEGHKDTWCNNVDPYTECTYIDTPLSHLAESYELLRTSRETLLGLMMLRDIRGIRRMKEIIHELKDVIKTYEKYI